MTTLIRRLRRLEHAIPIACVALSVAAITLMLIAATR